MSMWGKTSKFRPKQEGEKETQDTTCTTDHNHINHKSLIAMTSCSQDIRLEEGNNN